MFKERDLFAPIAGLIIALLIGYGCWVVGRKLNYYFSYEEQVKTTVISMVKPECLAHHQP